jgi:hypothetical protein
VQGWVTVAAINVEMTGQAAQVIHAPVTVAGAA